MPKYSERYYNPYCFFLVNFEHVSVYNMTDNEIKESIVNDILDLIFTEKLTSVPLNTLYRFIINDNFLVRYVNLMLDELIESKLVVRTPAGNVFIPAYQYQRSMDYCGTWFEGFDPPEGANALVMSPEARDMINENGIDAFVDFMINQYVPKTDSTTLVDESPIVQ